MVAALKTRYPGAQPFADDELSRRLFRGREEEAKKLTDQILANRFVVLFARSGLGKTSLLNAGVLETLRGAGLVPLIIRVNDAKCGPLECIYRSLAEPCKCQGIEYKPGNKESLWEFFKTAEFWRDDILLTPVLVFDQFEELFTLQPEEERGKFIDQFSHLVRGIPPKMPEAPTSAATELAWEAPPRVKIVLSMREDFVCQLEEFADRIPEILDQRFRLLPLARLAASRAIEEPARFKDSRLDTRRFIFEPEVKKLILDFLTRPAHSSIRKPSYEVEPFQLQLICQYIEDTVAKKQRKGVPRSRRVTLAQIGGEAGLGRIFGSFYKRQLKFLPFFQRRRAKRLCSEYLISQQGRRLLVEESDIERRVGVNAESLQKLAERRLLRAEQRAEGTYYELSHDTLIEPVLASRRLYFLLRAAVALALVILVATVVFGVSVSMIAETPRENWADFGKNWAFFMGVGTAILIFGLIFGPPAFWYYKHFTDMVRRLKIRRRA